MEKGEYKTFLTFFLNPETFALKENRYACIHSTKTLIGALCYLKNKYLYSVELTSRDVGIVPFSNSEWDPTGQTSGLPDELPGHGLAQATTWVLLGV